jgi:hypothetical protein
MQHNAADITPEQRSQVARLASFTSWGNTENRTARTAPARRAFDNRFLEEAGGDPLRADALRKAYFARLAYKSAAARRRRGAMVRRGSTRPGGAD